MIGAFASFVAAVAAAFASAIRAGTSFLTFVGSIPGRVSGFFSNAGSILLGAGRAIMEGLLNGIKAAWNNVRSYLSGLAAEIKSLKGPIQKDRRLLIPEGKAIMAGLGQGLTAGYRDVSSLVGGMADDIAHQMDPVLRGGMALDASYSGAISADDFGARPTEVTVVTNLDGKVLARTVNSVNTRDARRG